MKPAIIRPELELKHEIKEVPARNVIYIRLFGDYKLNDYCSAWMRLCQFIQEEKLPIFQLWRFQFSTNNNKSIIGRDCYRKLGKNNVDWQRCYAFTIGILSTLCYGKG